MSAGMSDDAHTRRRNKPPLGRDTAMSAREPARAIVGADVPLASLLALLDLGLSEEEIAVYFRRFRGAVRD